MKAIQVREFGGPEVLKAVDVPDPKPGPGQVLVRVQAIGVNPVDTYIRAGWYGPREFPYTPGSDAGGVVEAVGDGVTKFRAGDRVYTASTISGAYAERALCDAKRAFPLPDKLTFQQGAAIGIPYGTAYYAIHFRGRVKPAETVLVHGASGGVGTAAVQLVRLVGATVIGTGGTDQGRQLVREQGAHHVLDHRAGDYLEQLKQLTGGRGVDVILEMLANVNLGKDLNVLAKHGRVVVVGSRGKVELDPRDTMSRETDIRGMTMNIVTDEQIAVIHAGLAPGLNNGTLKPVVGKVMPLADAAKAHVAVMEAGSYGKIVLVP
jgi:NADPH2:quinone reductase